MSTTSRLISSVSNDPEKPNFIWAPSPHNRKEAIRLFVNPEVIAQMADDNLNAGIGQFAGLVHGTTICTDEAGNPLQINTSGLLASHALFKGLNRDMIDSRRGDGVYVYVTNPEHDYVYPQGRRFDMLGPLRARKPSDSIFTTFVDLDAECVAHAKANFAKAKNEDFQGLVQNWCWALCSTSDRSLPDDYQNRYGERLWLP